MRVDYDPVQGRLALAALANASGRVVVNHDEWQNALLTALVAAEVMAAKAGFAVAIPSEQNVPGVLIGGARDRAKQLQTPEATIYLATQGAVRLANATSSRPTQLGAPVSVGVPQGDAVGPLAIVLVVVGVAALVGAAWYAGKYTGKVEADGNAAAKVAAVQSIAELAAGGGPIDPAALAALTGIAQKESEEGSGIPWPIVGIAVGAVGTAYAYNRWGRRGKR